MAINIGSSSISNIYIGDTAVKSVYLGDKLVYINKPDIEDSSYNYFVFDTNKASYTTKVVLQDWKAGDTTEWDGLTDWGDGTVDTELSHIYAEDGIYIVKTKYCVNKENGNSNAYTVDMLIRCENINKNITNLDYFFYECDNLTYINTDFDTSNVISMKNTFCRCYSLEYLDLSSWNTSKVTTMYNTFYYCSNLTYLNLSNWDTSKVTTMYYMFSGCSNLTSLDLSSFYTNIVVNMDYIFSKCYKLISLNLSNWNMDNVTSTISMFYRDINLTIDNVIMTNCNDATKTKIQNAINNK